MLNDRDTSPPTPAEKRYGLLCDTCRQVIQGNRRDVIMVECSTCGSLVQIIQTPKENHLEDTWYSKECSNCNPNPDIKNLFTTKQLIERVKNNG